MLSCGQTDVFVLLEAIASRVEAIAITVEAIAIGLEVIGQMWFIASIFSTYARYVSAFIGVF